VRAYVIKHHHGEVEADSSGVRSRDQRPLEPAFQTAAREREENVQEQNRRQQRGRSTDRVRNVDRVRERQARPRKV
jgi:hypothetical protein